MTKRERELLLIAVVIVISAALGFMMTRRPQKACLDVVYSNSSNYLDAVYETRQRDEQIQCEENN